MGNKSICIIEDNDDISDLLKLKFSEKDFKVNLYKNTEDFHLNFENDRSQAYIIDLNLPGANGIKAMELIRGSNKLSPIFMISGDSNYESIEAGFAAGADDYITKPFNIEKLYLLIKNATEKYSVVKEVMKRPSYQFIFEANTFIQDKLVVNLTSRESIILNELIEKKNQAVSREELINAFGKSEIKDIRNVDIHVFSLRKKMSDTPFQIKSIRHIGYMLVEL